ncbi:unnamed protein product [Penicillium manginii]
MDSEDVDDGGRPFVILLWIMKPHLSRRDQEIFSIGRPQPYLAREGIYPGHAVTEFCPIRKSAIAELWKFMLLDIMETECEFWPSKWEKARESQQEYLRIMLKAEEAE